MVLDIIILTQGNSQQLNLLLS